MTVLFYLLLGVATALLYFGHLYWQISALAKGSGRTFLPGFSLRFGLLCLWLGVLFWADSAMAVYTVGGLIAGRFGMQYFVHAKR